MKRTLITLALTLSVAGPAMADLALATAKSCMACHAMDKKVVGPSYKEVAAKYAGQKDAVDKLAGKIMKGGGGVWGPVPMPANAQVNEADAKKLAAWVLTVKSAAGRQGTAPSPANKRHQPRHCDSGAAVVLWGPGCWPDRVTRGSCRPRARAFAAPVAPHRRRWCCRIPGPGRPGGFRGGPAGPAGPCAFAAAGFPERRAAR